MCLYPYESIAIEVSRPTLFIELRPSMKPDGIAPPVLVGVAVGDIATLIVKLN